MTAGPFLFDTHAHLDYFSGEGDLDKEMQEARRAGVGEVVVPGVFRRGWDALLRLTHKMPGVWAAPGLHPQAAREWDSAAEAALSRLLAEPGVVAVGEIGLDGLIEVPFEVQERAFRGQLRLARDAGLPVLIHCRKSTGNLLKILREEKADRCGGVLHAFSGSVETARQGIDLGFAISFGGTLTYPGARRAPQALEALPCEWIVLETDAPDLPPHPHRGETNRPAWLVLVAERAAQIRGWTLEETARVTTQNAKRILKLG